AFLERILWDRGEELLDLVLNGHEQPDVLRVPLDIRPRFSGSSLIRIGPEIDDGRPPGRIACAGGDVTVDHGKMDFPIVPPNGVQLATLAKVKDLFPWPLLYFSLEVRQEVETIRMDFEGSAIGLISLHQLLDDIRLSGCRQQGRHPVFL